MRWMNGAGIARAGSERACARWSTCIASGRLPAFRSWRPFSRVKARMSSAENTTPLQVFGYGRVRQAVELAVKNAAGFEHAAGLAHVFEHHVAAGDVLENGVGIDEVERLVGENAPGWRRRWRARGRAGCLRSRSRARRIISSETSTPWISPKWRLSGFISRPGPHPISSARQARRLASCGRRFSSCFQDCGARRGRWPGSQLRPDRGCRKRRSNARLRARAGSSPRACARRRWLVLHSSVH